AESTLLSLQNNIGGDFVKARQIQVMAKRENQTIALEKFKELTQARNLVPWPIDVAMRTLDVAGWKEPAEKILRAAMNEPDWNTYLAWLFASIWNPNLANDLPDRIGAID